MSFDEFIELRNKGVVAYDLDPLLTALLLDASGNWDEAHRIAQNIYNGRVVGTCIPPPGRRISVKCLILVP